MVHSFNGAERRQHVRIFKTYSLFFYLKYASDKKSDASFIKDISKGGVRFTTSRLINIGTHLVFEIGIPYIAPKKLTLEGTVILCKEISSVMYEVRARFIALDEETIKVFDMVEKQNLKDRKNYGLS